MNQLQRKRNMKADQQRINVHKITVKDIFKR